MSESNNLTVPELEFYSTHTLEGGDVVFTGATIADPKTGKSVGFIQSSDYLLVSRLAAGYNLLSRGAKEGNSHDE